MSNYEILNLYPHNIKSYEKIKDAFKNGNIAAIVHCTGSGKSYNALQLALDNPDKKIVYIVPYNSIIEHLQEIMNGNNKIDKSVDFKNLEFKTYNGLTRLSKDELQNIKADILILDEFHHIGAPVWGGCIKEIINSNPNLKILGMTAYPVRSRGTIFERNMVNPEADELFSNKVVSSYDISEAIVDGVLPKPIYKSAYLFLENTLKSLEDSLKNYSFNLSKKYELSILINEIKEKIHKVPSVKSIFKDNIKKDGKYIYFCPIGSNVDNAIKEAKTWIEEMGLGDNDFCLYKTTNDMQLEGKKNRKAFYNDKDLNDNDISDKLRIMFAINQYNEGSHAPGIDGVIMGRGTSSEVVFYEQLGRGLSTRPGIKEEYIELNKKPMNEIIELCNTRHINTENKKKRELIELLISPVIIDLANNIDFIKKLENDLKARIEEKERAGYYKNNPEYKITPVLNIQLINQNLYDILKYVEDRLSSTWEDYYLLAEQYFEHKGNLYIPNEFKTINGYEYDPNGYSLGEWLVRQKKSYQSLDLSQKRIVMLETINIDWNLKNNMYFNKLFSEKLHDVYYGDFYYIGDYDEIAELNKIDDEEFLNMHYDIFGPEFIDAYMSLTAKSFEEQIDEKSDFDLEKEVINKSSIDVINEIMNNYTDMEKDILNHRFGLNGYEEMTLDALGKKYGVSGNYIGFIQKKLLARMGHPYNYRKLKDYLFDDYKSQNDELERKQEYLLYVRKMLKDPKLSELIDFFYGMSWKQQEKSIRSLCQMNFKVRVKDFLEVIEKYKTNNGYKLGDWLEIPYIYNEIINFRKLYSDPVWCEKNGLDPNNPNNYLSEVIIKGRKT